MKTLALKLTLFLFVSIFFTSCTPEDDGIYFEKLNETKSEYASIELETLDRINDYRASKGLKTLKILNIISGVALTHTNYMVEKGETNHDNFPQRHENLILIADAKLVGENVAYGFSSAANVVKAWLKSEKHRAIIENKNYTHFGISAEKNSEGKYFFTQLFIEQ